MDATITVDDVHKRYRGTTALDGMTFEVHPGEVTGFVGPNGAGKSTTLRVLLGLDAADAGRALLNGRSYRSLERPLDMVGALLDAAALHPARSGRNHLLWLAHSQGYPSSRVDAVLDGVGLAAAARRRAGGYSLGMRQRLGLAAARLGDPPILLLDEPFNGLDPEGIVWMREQLVALADDGRTVLVSSHLMSELEGMSRHLLVVGRGRVLADTTVQALVESSTAGRVTVHTEFRERATVALQGTAAIVVTGRSPAEVVATLNSAGVPFSEVAIARVSLEAAYLDLTRGVGQYEAPAGAVDKTLPTGSTGDDL
jgi:ABC-2 type transport system ATP-binding protein